MLCLDGTYETKDAKNDTNEIVDTDKAAEKAEYDTNDGKVCKQADEPTYNSYDNKEDNELDKEGCKIPLLIFKGVGPSFLSLSLR